MDINKLLSLFIFLVYINAAYCTTCSSEVVGTSTSLAETFPKGPFFVHDGKVVFDSNWVIGCCGVITQWDFLSEYPETMVLQVWRPVVPASHQYLLVGEIQEIVNAGTISITVSDPARQIPVQPGDLLGWYGLGYDNLRFNESLTNEAQNTLDIYLKDIDSGLSYVVGQTFTFSTTALNAMDFAITATVGAGSVPVVSNLPHTETILNSQAVSSWLFQIQFNDANSMDVTSLSLDAVDPPGSLFDVNSTSGDVTLAQSLVGNEGTHVLVVSASDGCNTSPQKNLTIVVNPVTTTAAPTTAAVTTSANTNTQAPTTASTVTATPTTGSTTQAPTTASTVTATPGTGSTTPASTVTTPATGTGSSNTQAATTATSSTTTSGPVQDKTVTNPPVIYNFWETLAGKLILFLLFPLLALIIAASVFALCCVYHKKTTQVDNIQVHSKDKREIEHMRQMRPKQSAWTTTHA